MPSGFLQAIRTKRSPEKERKSVILKSTGKLPTPQDVRSDSLKVVAPQWLTHGFGLLSLGVEDGEFELGAHLGLRTADQQQVERQVVFALLVQALRIHSQTPDGERV